MFASHGVSYGGYRWWGIGDADNRLRRPPGCMRLLFTMRVSVVLYGGILVMMTVLEVGIPAP